MKTFSGMLAFFSGKLTRNARLILFIITLLLFILAAGAPCATGSVGI